MLATLYMRGTALVRACLRLRSKGFNVDPPDVVPEGYEPEIVWEGLGALDYSIAPHFRSDHPESPLIDGVVEYFIQHGMAYRTLTDGEVIVAETGR